jgi:hypothetical protein
VISNAEVLIASFLQLLDEMGAEEAFAACYGYSFVFHILFRPQLNKFTL